MKSVLYLIETGPPGQRGEQSLSLSEAVKGGVAWCQE